MKVFRVALLSSVLPFAACAPDVYRVDVGAMFARGDGDTALQDSGASLVLHGHQHDLDQDLGLGDTEAAPYVRFEAGLEAHRLRLDGFGFSTSGNGSLVSNFGDIPSGSLVATSMDFLCIGANYSYGLLQGEDYRLGVGARLGYYGLDVEARSGALRETVDTEAVVPMPFAEAEYDFGQVSVGASLGVMGAKLQDASGRWVDFEAIVRWEPVERVDLFAGYRMIVLDAFGRATDRDFDSDVNFDGLFVGGGVRF